MSEKLAEALGAVMCERDSFWQVRIPSELCLQIASGEWKSVRELEKDGYFDSLEGEKAVERFVETVWCVDPGWLQVECREHGAVLNLMQYRGLTANHPRLTKRFAADTKPEAYAAAALWLAEQKGVER